MSLPAPLAPFDGDPYEVLGLAPTATQDDIKKAYFAQVRAHPPEREPAVFKRIRAAYDRLNTPAKKLDTDMTRAEAWTPAPPPTATATLTFEVARADVFRAARALSDLARTDWADDYRDVKL